MVRDLLAAGRIANLPTVWTNVLVGAAIGISSDDDGLTLGLSFIFSIIAGSLLYIAGCFYNDYHDRYWDAEHKPERALPSGRLKASVLVVLIFACTLIGVFLCSLIGIQSLIIAWAILTFIFIYTRIHKKTPLAIIPMGLCRAGLYFLGFVSVSKLEGGVLLDFIPVVPPALGLMLYIAGITLVARSEASEKISNVVTWVGLSLLFIPVFTHFIQWKTGISAVLFFIGGSLLILFLKSRVERSIGGFVSLCLAGICVIDGGLLLNLAPRAFGEMSFYISLGVLVGGFGLSTLLQKVAPAT